MKLEWWKLARRGVILAIVACCVAGLTGCDDEDEDEGGDVVGTWNIGPDSGADSTAREVYVFNSDGSISKPGDGEFVSGSYTLSGNEITISWTGDDGFETWTITATGTVSGDSMSGTWTSTEAGSPGGTWSGTRA